MKMKRNRLVLGVGILFVVAAPFIGFDHYIGDHEIGDSWQPFIKYYPIFNFKFRNPAQLSSDVEPYEKLNYLKKESVKKYCKIRYWIGDIGECYKIMMVASY